MSDVVPKRSRSKSKYGVSPFSQTVFHLQCANCAERFFFFTVRWRLLGPEKVNYRSFLDIRGKTGFLTLLRGSL